MRAVKPGWSWDDVILSYLHIQKKGATERDLARAFPEGRSRLAERLEALARGGSVARQGKTYSLTPKGREAVPEVARRRGLTIKMLKGQVFPALAAGLEPPGAAMKKPREVLAGALLSGVLGHTPVTLNRARDALLWRALGVESEESFSLERVRVELLGRYLGGKKPRDTKQGIDWVLAREAGLDGDLAAGLRKRFMASLDDSSPADGSAVAADQSDFAHRVLQAARRTEQRFGEDRVYIIAVFRTLSDPSLTLPAFKERLLEAHQDRRLELRRADLAAAMDPAVLRDSEITGPTGATYHFILLKGEA